MRLSEAEARVRVARGAAHLDEVRPGWWQLVDVGTLDLGSPYCCVVGQLDGRSYGKGMARLRLSTAIDTVDDVAISHGFFADHGVSFQELQEAWIAAIADRRLAQGDNGPARQPVDVRGTDARGGCLDFLFAHDSVLP